MPPIIPDFSDDGKAVSELGQKSFSELQRLVLNWARARSILANAKPYVQLMKTGSELGELFDAEIKGDMPGIIDGIGDVLVTLIIYAELRGVELRIVPNVEEKLSSAWQLMYVGEHYGDLLSSERMSLKGAITRVLSYMLGEIDAYASCRDLVLADCLASAYNEIKDRTGTLLPNGVFVKDEP